jgi:hypothetical protein
MAKYSGHEIDQFFRRNLQGKVTFAEQVAAKKLLKQICTQAFDRRKGGSPANINSVDDDAEVDGATIQAVADRLAKAANDIAAEAKRFNGHNGHDD